jgi:hypothetical protein
VQAILSLFGLNHLGITPYLVLLPFALMLISFSLSCSSLCSIVSLNYWTGKAGLPNDTLIAGNMSYSWPDRSQVSPFGRVTHDAHSGLQDTVMD